MDEQAIAQQQGYHPLPQLCFEGQSFNPKQCVEKGTGVHSFIGFLALIVGLLVGAALTYGILLLSLLIAPIVDYFNRKKAMALMKGSGIEVGPNQFAELDACAKGFAQRLGLKQSPRIFIIEDNTINAYALKIGGQHVVMLLDDTVDACLRSGDPRTLAFFLAHEMAHHALGHTGMFRRHLTAHYKTLSRLDEFSCDRVAHQLVGDEAISMRAIIVLACGPLVLPTSISSNWCSRRVKSPRIRTPGRPRRS